MPHETYLPSDLAGSKRKQFLDEARGGRARVRFGDGVTLVMLPENELEVLDAFAKWSLVQQRLDALSKHASLPSVAELGDLAWIRVFDQDDVAAFADELHGALITGLADKDISFIEEVVEAWRLTARQMEDPLRKAILTSPLAPSDFEEVASPE